MEPIAWDTHFTKGWTDESLWREYMQARDAKDFFNMDCILRAQGAERRPVDARIWATESEHLDLYNQFPSAPDAFLSRAREDEHDQLVELSTLRDLPLTELPHYLPEPLRKNSYFARHIQVVPYTAGVNYLDSIDEYMHIQAGNLPTRIQEKELDSRIPSTGRDWATYVHKDNPMKLWTAVVQELMALKVPVRTGINDSICREDAAFVCGGMPFWWAVIGDVIGAIGPLNFRSKHEHMAARPEEYAFKRFNTFLSMAFAEGSPMHGSFRAMHDAIARAVAAAVKWVFDNFTLLPNGNPVGYEVDLLAGNVSDGRQWAGVHTQADNRKGIPLATAIGERIAQKHLANLGTA